jgi:hypothetical protein
MMPKVYKRGAGFVKDHENVHGAQPKDGQRAQHDKAGLERVLAILSIIPRRDCIHARRGSLP